MTLLTLWDAAILIFRHGRQVIVPIAFLRYASHTWKLKISVPDTEQVAIIVASGNLNWTELKYKYVTNGIASFDQRMQSAWEKERRRNNQSFRENEGFEGLLEDWSLPTNTKPYDEIHRIQITWAIHHPTRKMLVWNSIWSFWCLFGYIFCLGETN